LAQAYSVCAWPVQPCHPNLFDIIKMDAPLAMPGDRTICVLGVEQDELLHTIGQFLESSLCADSACISGTKLSGTVFDDFVPLALEASAYADFSSASVIFKHFSHNDSVSFRKLVASVANFLRDSGNQVVEPIPEMDEQYVGLCDLEFDDSDCDFLCLEPSWVECIDVEVPNLVCRSAMQREEALQVLACMAQSTKESRTPLAWAFANKHQGLISSMITSLETMSLREAFPFAALLQYSTSEIGGAALMFRFVDILADAVNNAQAMPKPIASKLAHALANMAVHMIKPCPTRRRSHHLVLPTKKGNTYDMADSLSERTTACSMRPSSDPMSIEDSEWAGISSDADQPGGLDLHAPTLDMVLQY